MTKTDYAIWVERQENTTLDIVVKLYKMLVFAPVGFLDRMAAIADQGLRERRPGRFRG